jgi:hypothetical protein
MADDESKAKARLDPTAVCLATPDGRPEPGVNRMRRIDWGGSCAPCIAICWASRFLSVLSRWPRASIARLKALSIDV